MDIRYRLYPYPVLASFLDDYVESTFDIEIIHSNDGYNLEIEFIYCLINEELRSLVKAGKAKIVYHLECSQTGYRRAFLTENVNFKVVLSSKDITGRLQICPFIVAVEELPQYVNNSFHEDYRGYKFNIEAGCILAVGSQRNIDIEKQINDLSNTPSVFSIIKNADASENSMLVDMDQNKIVIKLPENDYYNIKSIKDEAMIQPLINSLIVIPALIYVLEEIAKREPEERFEYSSYSWYRAIKKALEKRFKCDIESKQISSINIVEVSHKLIGNPLPDALQVLSSGFGNVEEDNGNEN